MTKLYEAMVLVSNQVVREDWRKAKGLVNDLFTKHNATVKSLRRYEERRLAYPIQGNLRATYYLAFVEADGQIIPGLRRDFELTEQVLRYLISSVDVIPEGELEAAALEEGADYTVPEPPADDEPEEEEVEETEEGEGDGEATAEEDSAAEGDAETKSETAEGEASSETESKSPETPAEA